MSISTTINAILALQNSYSSKNTPEMQERGRLVRDDLADHVRALAPVLRQALGEFGADFEVGASDGIGRKTEACWVRFHSHSMAPTPRDGFYVVIHFSADGSASWLTLGCGSTLWLNGDLKELPAAELLRRTSWARNVVVNNFATIDPYSDQIALGTKAKLPKTFERATAIAKRMPAGSSAEDIEFGLVALAERLREVYRAQRTGADLPTAADQIERELQEVSRPGRPWGQGFGLTGPQRKAIEDRAMAVATAWLETEKWEVEDMHKTSSFDLQAKRGAETLKVEVKGTTAQSCDAIFMTRNEVALHQAECGTTGLILVPGIKLMGTPTEPIATDGTCEALLGWDINAWTAEPLSFRVRRD